MQLEYYLAETLGHKATILQYKIETLPFYLQNEYEYKILQVENSECILVVPKNKEIHFSSIKKHYKKLSEIISKKCVLIFEKITTYQRKNMIEENIYFIVLGKQIYLPFLGIALNDKNTAETIAPNSFTPSTQLIMLYLYYTNWDITNATELSIVTGLSRMTTARAIKDLVLLELISEIGENTHKKIILKMDKQGFLQKSKKYLNNPVSKTIYLKNRDSVENKWVSGLSALSEKTMLMANENELCFATNKETSKRINKLEIFDKSYYEVYSGIKLEIWSYNPGFLTKNNIVDDISLILSLQNVTDERVEKMIDEIKEQHKW